MLALSKAGAQRESFPTLDFTLALNKEYRCDARNKELDAPGANRRSRNITEMLVNDFALGDLWDNYGIVGDIIVCRAIL